jgi:hypothetical protein
MKYSKCVEKQPGICIIGNARLILPVDLDMLLKSINLNRKAIRQC